MDDSVNTFFLALKELPKVNADVITQCIVDVFQENGLLFSKCVGLGSDEARVMTVIHRAQLNAAWFVYSV